MTAMITEIGVRERDKSPDLPPAVQIRISRFLTPGYTGKIILNVKDGEIRSCEITEFIDARAPLDKTNDDMKD